MSLKRVCDMCDGKIELPFYQFEASLKECSDNYATGQVMNISKPVADVCKDCGQKLISALSDISLPTIATTQT